MTKIDPTHRFSSEAVRAFDAGDKDAPSGKINEMAHQIAAQYRRDTLSPVMAKGIIRLVEFALLMLSGLVIHATYVGYGIGFNLQYFVLITTAPAAAVLFLEMAGSYQIARLRQFFSGLGTIVLMWGGTIALMALAVFFLKISDGFSRFWLGAWFAAGLAVLVVERFVV